MTGLLTSGQDAQIMRYIPKSKRHTIESCWKDSCVTYIRNVFAANYEYDNDL